MSRIGICSQKQLNAWAHHYLQAVICRSHGGLLANEKEETFALNDNNCCTEVLPQLVQIISASCGSSFLCFQAMDDFLMIKYLGYFQELPLGSSLYLLELASPFEEVCSRWFCTLLFLCPITFPTFFRPPQHTSSFAVLADRLETGWDVRLLMRRLRDRWFVGAQI